MRRIRTNYMIFWSSQAVSQFGSALTGYALIIWAYENTHSAMAVSLLTFCTYLPYIITSIFAGTFVDRYSKKTIMVLADTVAALCTLSLLVSSRTMGLNIFLVYGVNLIIGFSNAFQAPASAAAIGTMVPKEDYEKVSGLLSFSDNLITMTSPMLAGMLYSFAGLPFIMVLDLGTFFLAVGVLIFVVKIEKVAVTEKREGVFSGFVEGCRFLKQHTGILYIMLTLALINFLSRLTYENILSPMILARSGGNTAVYGIVSGVLGAGGILGGILVAKKKKSKNYVKMIYVSAAVSFLFGDLLMGIGQNAFFWCIAGLAASVPIPFVMAAQRVILYEQVPQEKQGRIFAVRNAIQYSAIPAGILLGGWLADYVFEPFMASENGLVFLLQKLVGQGDGSGMAVMFLCTGILGTLASVIGYKKVSKAGRL